MMNPIRKKTDMKKHKKMPINIPHDEGFEEYLLYPENAITDTEQTEQGEKFNQNPEKTTSVIDSAHKVVNMAHLTIVRSDD